jgi:DNA topoisomerase II
MTLRTASLKPHRLSFLDGSHIKGLVINFFKKFWPKILQLPTNDSSSNAGPGSRPFMSYFITPLLKATKKGSKTTIPFYSMAEFKKWQTTLSLDDQTKWTIKYYKGLGTSTPVEAKQYFEAFDKHVRPYHWGSDVDGELLDMVFDKKRAADRRHWILQTYSENADVVANEDDEYYVSYADFINKEMIHFSNADNVRSIPNALDGLKPSQRKVLYACFKRKLTTEIKVAQLSGYCAEHTAYHHGEMSLQSTSK